MGHRFWVPLHYCRTTVTVTVTVAPLLLVLSQCSYYPVTIAVHCLLSTVHLSTVIGTAPLFTLGSLSTVHCPLCTVHCRFHYSCDYAVSILSLSTVTATPVSLSLLAVTVTVTVHCALCLSLPLSICSHYPVTVHCHCHTTVPPTFTIAVHCPLSTVHCPFYHYRHCAVTILSLCTVTVTPVFVAISIALHCHSWLSLSPPPPPAHTAGLLCREFIAEDHRYYLNVLK